MMNLDITIIGLFLAATFAIGIYYGRGIKTFQEYAVGNRKMSTTVITLSLIATMYGGRFLHLTLDSYYRKGLDVCIRHLLNPIGIYLFSRFLILRMKGFIGNHSIAESMGVMYGPVVQMLTGMFSIFMTIGALSVQIQIAFNVISSLLPQATNFSTYFIIPSILFIISYATLRGARAVAWTDVYQFFLFGLCFPLLVIAIVYHCENHTANLAKLLTMPQFNLSKICTWDKLSHLPFSSVIVMALVMTAPEHMQRFYMASSISQAAKIFTRTSIIPFIMPFLILSVAIALHIGGHLIQPNQNVLQYIIELDYFPGMRGILVTTILALLMSTADSNLHTASVLFVNDIWLITHTKYLKSTNLLKVVRITSICVSIISFFMVWYTNSITHLMMKAIYLYDVTISIPFIMTCLGFKPSAPIVVWNIAINSTIILFCCIFYQEKAISYENIFNHMIFSLFILMAGHYLLPKQPHTGWVGIKDRSAWDLQNQLIKRRWLTRYQPFKAMCTKAYLANIFPQKGATFILLGIYILTSTILALCYTTKSSFFSHIYGYASVMAIGTVIMLYPSFHSYRQGGTPSLHVLWMICLFLLLFVVPMQFIKLSDYRIVTYALAACSIGLAVVLLSLELGGIMLLIALCIQKWTPLLYLPQLFGANSQNISSIEIALTSILLTAVLVGCSLYKYLRDKSSSQRKVMELTRTYEHRISLEAIYNQANWSRLHALDGTKLLQNLADQFKETSHALYAKHPDKLKNEIDRFVGKLYKFGNTMQWRAQEERSLKLDEAAVQWTAIEPVVLKVNQYVLNLGEPIALLLRKHTTVEAIRVDPSLFECLLMLNLCEIAKSKQAEDHIVVVTIEDTTLQYSADQASLTLPALSFCFSTDSTIKKTAATYLVLEITLSSTLPPSQGQFYQIESRQMVEAHGGYSEIVETAESLTCLYVLPVNGHKVMRLKNYNLVYLVKNKVAETRESIAQEKELVSLLIANTSLTQETVEKAIACIKNAHGLVVRKSGAPYYTHPMAVAQILLEVTEDPDTILAGLLHDVVEDTPITLHQIALVYGEEIALIVDKVTEYNTVGYCWKLEKAQQKEILNACGDLRVVAVKLADRLHNMRTLYARKPEDQQRIAKETLTFYIPWGERNKGPKAWLKEMSEICQKVLQKRES